MNCYEADPQMERWFLSELAKFQKNPKTASVFEFQEEFYWNEIKKLFSGQYFVQSTCPCNPFERHIKPAQILLAQRKYKFSSILKEHPLLVKTLQKPIRIPCRERLF